MINLDNFEPYNSISCIDQLIEAAREDKLFLNWQIQVDILMRIRKIKVQLYFKECVESYNNMLQSQYKIGVHPEIKSSVTYNVTREYVKQIKPKKNNAYRERQIKLNNTIDVDNFLLSISDNDKEVLRQNMGFVKRIDPYDRELKDYFIKKMRELIRRAEDKELMEIAKNAKVIRKNSTSDGKSHRPYLVFYPVGGQNRKY